MFRPLVDSMNASPLGAWLLKLLTTRRALWLVLPLAALVTGGVVRSAGAPATNATIALATDPLYSRGVRAKPALALALSVEFPTTGQTYQGNYVPANEYIGYFDASSCYTYNDTKKQYDYLGRSGSSTSNGVVTYNHLCSGAGFSGNFMNWATSSAIDILRYGMTGGDRIVDTTTETVLQRAVLQSSFYNSSNFVAKSIDVTTAANALPATMLSTRPVSTVWIANCLNRVHFGTASTGNCSAPGDNTNLGTATTTGSLNTNVNSATAKPADVSYQCAAENGTCTISGTREVWYGTGSTWFYKTFTSSTACSNGVFGDPISGTVKACWIRQNSSATTTSSTTNATYLTTDSFFTVRVGVCNSSSAGTLLDPRTSLCTLYPNGSYKPTGNLQQYSDSVRVAAMGYLYDSSPARYGGVLRAPMKYVGPKAYDANFNLVAGANPKREWDETTGIFVRNPEGSDNPQGTGATAISGVINYLNQFGRTGATPGSYKTYDPVGELYYETLRYLQGLSPTPQAISGLTDTFADGYPVYTSWTDPLPQVAGLNNTGDYSCVRTNILTIGDIHTHFDRSLPGYLGLAGSSTNDFARLPNIANNEQDFLLWTTKVGLLEGIPTLGTNTSQDNGNYFMVGAAYWAHTNDFRPANWTVSPDKQRPGMRVKTYMIDVDEYGQSSASFGTRSNSQLYLAAKYGGFNDASGTGNPFLNALGLPDLLSNWQQANGDASTYFLAGNPQAMLASISQIFQQIAQSANSIAGGAINTSRLSSAGGDFYQAQFDPTYWSGDLLDRVLATATNGTISTATSTVRWDAANLLASRTSAQPRNIVVGRYKDDVTTQAAATPFIWSNLDARYQTALRTPAYTSVATPDSAASGAERVNYLRGDRSLESPSGPYRKRGTLIGDIVNSGVTYKGEPTAGLTDTGYAAFYNGQFDTNGNLTRNKAVYVGANDGMLHSFDAANGNELFAYIPSFVVPYLVNLTNPSYIHRSYVDSTPAVEEAQLDTTNTSSWKTVLVSGAGGGGQGVFALDVTTPASFSAANVLWEFTELNDPDLGNVVGKPRIVKIRTSAPNATVPVYKWYAAVTSGVNSNANDGNFNSDGQPALFFLELGKARATTWQLGVNYFKVKFTQSSGTLAYGMVGFNTVVGGAGELAQLYAGDLQGNLWKLNFATAAQTNAFNVNVNSLLSVSTGSVVATRPLFVAKNGVTSAATVQPITDEPSVAYGYNQTTLITFGTGKFLEPSDIAGPYTGQVQSIYTLLDDDATLITGRSMLTSQTASAATQSVTGSNQVWGGTGNPYGWYFDLPYSTSGERQVSSLQVLYGNVYFSTVIPALGGCDPGSGNDYTLSLLTGAGGFVRSTVGLLGPQAAIEIAPTAAPLPPDSTGRRIKKGLIQTLSQGTNGIVAGAAVPNDIITGRLTWRQIMNYQDLHNATTP